MRAAGSSAVEARTPCAAADRSPRRARVDRAGPMTRSVAPVNAIDVEHFRPRPSRVGSLEDAALGAFAPEIADRGDERDIRIGRMEHDAANRARVVQAEIGPRFTGVGRPIHTAAPRRALPVVVLAGPCPDDPRVALEDRQRAERVVGLPAEDVLPGDALVGGLPDAAAGRAQIEDGGILRIDLEIVDAAASRRRTDVAEVQPVERAAGPAGYCARMRAGDGRREGRPTRRARPRWSDASKVIACSRQEFVRNQVRARSDRTARSLRARSQLPSATAARLCAKRVLRGVDPARRDADPSASRRTCA